MSEMDSARIVEVDGVRGRLIPLRVRGAQRRSGAGFEDGEIVRVVLPGVYRADGPAVDIRVDGHRRGLQGDQAQGVAVSVNGKTMMSVGADKITRKTDRRKGKERRKS